MVQRISNRRIDRIVDEWIEIWRREAMESGETNSSVFSEDYRMFLMEQARRGPFCRECGIPCSSYGLNKKGEPVCLYCEVEKAEEKGEPFPFPLPTHGVPFYIYVEKHRKWCRQHFNCEKCNAKPVCDRLDSNPADPTLVDFSLKEYVKTNLVKFKSF